MASASKKNSFGDAVKGRLDEEIQKRQKEISQKTSALIKDSEEGSKMVSFGKSSGDHKATDSTFVPDYESGHLDHLKAEILQFEKAKKRVDTGEYGICFGCGEAISLKRLNVMPLTENCTDCASAKEKEGKKLCRKGSDPTRRKYAFMALRG